jgi:hypothetical protein
VTRGGRMFASGCRGRAARTAARACRPSAARNRRAQVVRGLAPTGRRLVGRCTSCFYGGRGGRGHGGDKERGEDKARSMLALADGPGKHIIPRGTWAPRGVGRCTGMHKRRGRRRDQRARARPEGVMRRSRSPRFIVVRGQGGRAQPTQLAPPRPTGSSSVASI